MRLFMDFHRRVCCQNSKEGKENEKNRERLPKSKGLPYWLWFNLCYDDSVVSSRKYRHLRDYLLFYRVGFYRVGNDTKQNNRFFLLIRRSKVRVLSGALYGRKQLCVNIPYNMYGGFAVIVSGKSVVKPMYSAPPASLVSAKPGGFFFSGKGGEAWLTPPPLHHSKIP